MVMVAGEKPASLYLAVTVVGSAGGELVESVTTAASPAGAVGAFAVYHHATPAISTTAATTAAHPDEFIYISNYRASNYRPVYHTGIFIRTVCGITFFG